MVDCWNRILAPPPLVGLSYEQFGSSGLGHDDGLRDIADKFVRWCPGLVLGWSSLSDFGFFFTSSRLRSSFFRRASVPSLVAFPPPLPFLSFLPGRGFYAASTKFLPCPRYLAFSWRLWPGLPNAVWTADGFFFFVIFSLLLPPRYGWTPLSALSLLGTSMPAAPCRSVFFAHSLRRCRNRFALLIFFSSALSAPL